MFRMIQKKKKKKKKKKKRMRVKENIGIFSQTRRKKTIQQFNKK